jgi:chromosome segregation ATPase
MLTLEESLKALKSAFTSKSGEAEAMTKEISELKAQNAALISEKASASSEVKALAAVRAERDAAIAKVEELTKALATVEDLKKQAVSQIESVGKKSAAIAASVGVVPVEISASDAATSKSPEEVWNEYLAISNPAEKQSFYNKNRASIVAHLGIK